MELLYAELSHSVCGLPPKIFLPPQLFQEDLPLPVNEVGTPTYILSC